MDDRLLIALLDQAPDAVIFADPGGLITYWNVAAERVFGHAADAVLGQRLDLIIPEAQREAHWRGFDRALGAGETKYAGKGASHPGTACGRRDDLRRTQLRDREVTRRRVCWGACLRPGHHGAVDPGPRDAPEVAGA